MNLCRMLNYEWRTQCPTTQFTSWDCSAKNISRHYLPSPDISSPSEQKKNRMIVISDVQDNHHDNIDFIRKMEAIESQTDKMIPFVYKTDTAGRSSIKYLDFSERYRIPDSNKIKVRIVLIWLASTKKLLFMGLSTILLNQHPLR